MYALQPEAHLRSSKFNWKCIMMCIADVAWSVTVLVSIVEHRPQEPFPPFYQEKRQEIANNPNSIKA